MKLEEELEMEREDCAHENELFRLKSGEVQNSTGDLEFLSSWRGLVRRADDLKKQLEVQKAQVALSLSENVPGTIESLKKQRDQALRLLGLSIEKMKSTNQHLEEMKVRYRDLVDRHEAMENEHQKLQNRYARKCETLEKTHLLIQRKGSSSNEKPNNEDTLMTIHQAQTIEKSENLLDSSSRNKVLKALNEFHRQLEISRQIIANSD